MEWGESYVEIIRILECFVLNFGVYFELSCCCVYFCFMSYVFGLEQL